MLRKKLLNRIDKMLCRYLGIAAEKVYLNGTKISNETLMITHTLSFKRHLLKESWTEFSVFSIKDVNSEDREKLGLAMGKTIAKNLVVSFEETPIKRA
jgi:hypothetical protein